MKQIGLLRNYTKLQDVGIWRNCNLPLVLVEQNESNFQCYSVPFQNQHIHFVLKKIKKPSCAALGLLPLLSELFLLSLSVLGESSS